MVLDCQTHLQPLQAHHRTKSYSSITSDAATFHSAQGHPQTISYPETKSPETITTFEFVGEHYANGPVSPAIEGIRMVRQDSGYSDGTQRASPSSSRRNSQTSFRKPKSPTTSVSRRDITGPHLQARRSSRATPNTVPIRSSRSSSLRRPEYPSRRIVHPQSQYFHFPILAEPLGYDPAATLNVTESVDREIPTPPPPATVHYWTSDSTRRLEYAAIDAASRGVRGLLVKLVPDCILPGTARRTRFHSEDADDSDAGSVRRYRLALPEDDGNAEGREKGTASGGKKSWWKFRMGLERK